MNVIGASGRRRRRPLTTRRAERELFFWTAREALKLIALTAATVYFLLWLIEGRVASEVLDVLLKIVRVLG